MPRCTWLYVLGSDEALKDSYVYVGMTYRLVTRLKEHDAGKGAHTTQRWDYSHLLAVYKIDDCEEHDHSKENCLTTQIMYLKGAAWWTVRGGSSTSTNKDRAVPKQLQLFRNTPSEKPRTCYCMLPCERKVSKEGKPYITCPRGNLQWLQDMIPQSVPDGCNFFDWDT
jgi:predicted GIY-YIG superfamily endonuclease